MVVRGTSIIDVGGVAGCRNACEDQCGEELKHACTRLQSITLLCPKVGLRYVQVMDRSPLFESILLFCKLFLIFEFNPFLFFSFFLFFFFSFFPLPSSLTLPFLALVIDYFSERYLTSQLTLGKRVVIY